MPLHGALPSSALLSVMSAPPEETFVVSSRSPAPPQARPLGVVSQVLTKRFWRLPLTARLIWAVMTGEPVASDAGVVMRDPA